jgi:hypothetical protein
MLTQAQVHDLFDYRDGQLYWRKSLNKRIKIGSLAGTVSSTGYIAIMINRKRYQAHRLIFLMHHGWLPEFIDHMDLDRQNNQLWNLRAATRTQNTRNTPVRRDSSSKVKNVYWVNRLGKWLVRMRIKGKPTHIGVFEDKDMAIFVASEYRDAYHGEFANHG